MPGPRTITHDHQRTHITPANAAWHLAAAVTATGLAAIAHPLATIAFCALFLWPLASDTLARRYSPHVVYILRDADHTAIYVGQTDDTMRRMYQHTDGMEHVWWRDIHGYTIWRHCWTDRQSRRIERRLVGVINSCAQPSTGLGMGSISEKLRNEVYGEDHQKRSRSLSIAVWKPVYLLASALQDSRAFHRPCTLSRSIPQRPNRGPSPDDFDLHDGPADSCDRTGDEPITATYERRNAGQSPAAIAVHSLPPVSCHNDEPVTARHSRADPFRGLADDRLSHPRRRDTSQTASSTADTIRDAHRRQQQATITALPDDLAAYLTDEEAEALEGMDADGVKTLRDRLRQRKSRANRAAAADRSPTYTARPRPRSGGGEGGGEG